MEAVASNHRKELASLAHIRMCTALVLLPNSEEAQKLFNVKLHQLVLPASHDFLKWCHAQERLTAAQQLLRYWTRENLPAHLANTGHSHTTVLRAYIAAVELQISTGDLSNANRLPKGPETAEEMAKDRSWKIWRTGVYKEVQLESDVASFTCHFPNETRQPRPVQAHHLRELMAATGNWSQFKASKSTALTGYVVGLCFAIFDDINYCAQSAVRFAEPEWIESICRGQSPGHPPHQRGPVRTPSWTVVPLNLPLRPRQGTTTANVKAKAAASGPMIGKHWVCLLIDHEQSTYTIFNSAGDQFEAGVTETLKRELSRFLGKPFRRQDSPHPPPQQARGSYDCGVWTIISAWMLGLVRQILDQQELSHQVWIWRFLLARIILEKCTPGPAVAAQAEIDDDGDDVQLLGKGKGQEKENKSKRKREGKEEEDDVQLVRQVINLD